jgi:hypothetical protein
VQWILDMHEAARSAATEEQWNAAKQKADRWLAANPGAVPMTAASDAGDTAPIPVAPLASAALPTPPVAISPVATDATVTAPLVPAVAVPTN